MQGHQAENPKNPLKFQAFPSIDPDPKKHPQRPQHRPLEAPKIDKKLLPNPFWNQHRKLKPKITENRSLGTSKTVLPLQREHNFHKIEAIRKSTKNHPERVPEMVPKSYKMHVWEPWKMQAENVYQNLRNLIPEWSQHGSPVGPKIIRKECLGALENAS